MTAKLPTSDAMLIHNLRTIERAILVAAECAGAGVRIKAVAARIRAADTARHTRSAAR